ncbi:hypothetical protein KL930_004926 [Ogataea haglerorum]|nr:hypothetical protein KL915_004724 [Ogataea haglerorum]KAG7699817.1 hypothetical protein KL951_001534 [Ogataea haglerorum]KAG7703093.1 hypothetical protein KL914_004874 [Ogataea haglerorum]KAG7703217.1 hypothetical protein KL950_004851 [Ogataea haglerorum]KAG7749730.1 hypothetical protein KL912_001731 [Ogataea haglerorum]
MNPPPHYDCHGGDGTCRPPEYTPAVHHVSLNFMYQEKTRGKRKLASYEPVIFEINSTQLNIYDIHPLYRKYASFYLDKLRPEYIDPELNIKVEPLGSDAGEMCSRGNGRVDSSGARQFFRRLSACRKEKPVVLSDAQLASKNCHRIHQLLLHRPDFGKLTLVDKGETDKTLQLVKRARLFTFSLQELIDFGNAADYPHKPFTLRLLFPQDQFLLTSYNSATFVGIYYKLNIARELSLDLDMRAEMPIDHSVPHRRSSGRASRSSSVATNESSVASVDSYDEDKESLFSEPLVLEATNVSETFSEKGSVALKQPTNSARKDVERYKELVYTIRCIKIFKSSN